MSTRRKTVPAAAPEPTGAGPLAVVYRPIVDLKPYARNARTHSAAQVAQIAASIREFGWSNPILIDDDREVIAGHGRIEAAKLLGMATVPTITLAGLTEAQRRGLRLADNRLALSAGWDDELLRAELSDLKLAGFAVELIGFADDELAAILEGEGDDSAAGSLLELVNVTIAEPRHQTARGDHWRLGGRHHLLCASVIEDHATWAPLLVSGTLFCPYPGPFVPFGAKADDNVLVMVQPDPYIAGHLLDRYGEVHGEATVAKAIP